MGINVHVKDEGGGILDSALDPSMLLSRFALQADAQESRLLRYLDPYGNLVLNRAQAAILVADLSGIIPRQVGALKSLLERVKTLAEEVAGGVHLYLWFEGD